MEPSKEIPENANTGCPGLQNKEAGVSSACQGCPNQKICSTSQANSEPDPCFFFQIFFFY